MDFWFDLLSNTIASFLGAFLGFLGGIKILKHQQEVDTIEKRNRVIESLLKELEIHEKKLKLLPIYRYQNKQYARIMPTHSFDSVISSGLFILLSKTTQSIVYEYYSGCISIARYAEIGNINPPLQSNEILRIFGVLNNIINAVTTQLESEIQNSPSLF